MSALLYAALVVVGTYAVTSAALFMVFRVLLLRLARVVLPLPAAITLFTGLYCPVCAGTWVAFGCYFLAPLDAFQGLPIPAALAQPAVAVAGLILFGRFFPTASPAEVTFAGSLVQPYLVNADDEPLDDADDEPLDDTETP